MPAFAGMTNPTHPRELYPGQRSGVLFPDIAGPRGIGIQSILNEGLSNPLK